MEDQRTTDNRAIWRCRCKCGNIISVSGHNLTSGHIKSCGCMRESLGEYKIHTLLDELNVDYQTQYKISECKNIYVLPFDFAIFQNNKIKCLIEYQGDIHFVSTGGWNSEEKLKKRQQNDTIKRNFCKNNNIRLIEILYTDYDKIDQDYLKGLIYNDRL